MPQVIVEPSHQRIQGAERQSKWCEIKTGGKREERLHRKTEENEPKEEKTPTQTRGEETIGEERRDEGRGEQEMKTGKKMIDGRGRDLREAYKKKVNRERGREIEMLIQRREMREKEKGRNVEDRVPQGKKDLGM